MRIACVHIPQFALQCATRIDPSLLRANTSAAVEAIVVAGPASLAGADSRAALHSPIVLACSRAAWALGARIGMTATTARTLSPEIRVVTADAQIERDTVRAIADTMLALSPVVDLGGRVGPSGAHLAMYCEVPPKTRGTSFGDRLLERLAALGLTARIGIADDRFTAWVAASSHEARPEARHDEAAVVSVPRGGSAAFLAPRPLSLLAITPEVQHMLESLGVRTLGEFAALPSPTVSSRFEADYQALARGESGNALRPYSPDSPIREDAIIHTAHGDAPAASDPSLSVPAAVALLAERVAMRLAGRARCAARLEITIGGAAGERTVTVSPVRDTASVLGTAESLADAIGSALGDDDTTQHAWRLRVVVTGEALAGDPAVAAEETAGADVTTITTATQRTFAIAAAPTAVPVAARLATGSGPARARSVGDTPSDLETLAVVLSSTGGAFGLTSPLSTGYSSERRDAHRRTRRGKQRRRTPQVTSAVQPRLFKL